MKTNMIEDLDLKSIVDDTSTEVEIRHIFRGKKDICKKYFGRETKECKKYNE